MLSSGPLHIYNKWKERNCPIWDRTHEALLHVSCFKVLSSVVCGMGIDFAAWTAFMCFRSFYTAFASLQVEPGFDVFSCNEHVSNKVANWNIDVVRGLPLFDFDLVLAKILTMMLQTQTMLPFFVDIDDAAILWQYWWCWCRRCCHSSTISTMLPKTHTMLPKTHTMLPFFGNIDNAATGAAVLLI